MTKTGPVPADEEKVWRYMSFARFVWLLQKKQLWLSRADVLGDPWEITLTGDQLAHVISRHPPITLPSPDMMPEAAMQRSERIIKMWRRQTFVNCWSASDHESHALWRIYCRSIEGVAIQTTFAKLRESIGSLPLYPVTYGIPGSNKQTPTLSDLVTKKRPMFAYEREVRVVLFTEGMDGTDPEQEPLGRGVDWDPEKRLELIRVHPEADSSFMETVTAVVRHYAPALKDCVLWSAMNARPPF
ncbi:MAG: hypothetical protein LAO78_17820 [Acidobacteriia bacterium]|nr:hypothetical protein [Terriglobia bacterium]